jgi:hypothetical protein
VILGSSEAYVQSGGDVVAFNESGVLWNVSLGATKTGVVNGSLVWWGTNDGNLTALDDGEIDQRINISTSPITSNVLMRNDTMWVTSNESLVRLDGGSVNWTVHATGNITGIVWANESVWVHGDNLTQVRDGSVIQTRNVSTGTAPPVSDGDNVFWSSGQGVTSENWTVNTTSKVRAAPLVTNDSVFISYDSGQTGEMVRVNKSTGDVVWSVNAPEAEQGMMARDPFIVYGSAFENRGLIYMNQSDGEIVTNGTGNVFGAPAADPINIWYITSFQGDIKVTTEQFDVIVTTPTPTPTDTSDGTPIPVGTSPPGPDPVIVFGGMTVIGIILVGLYAVRGQN